MAYDATVTHTESMFGGRRYHIYTVTETGVALATNEFQLTSVPKVGYIVAYRAVLTPGVGGTATTIDPELGEVTTGKDRWENGAAAATIRAFLAVVTVPTDGILYGRSGANGTTAGAGSIVSTIVIAEGHLA